MFFLLAAAGLILAGAAYQAAGSYRDRRRFRPPGRLIDIGGRSLHVNESGSGSPAVILEAGIAASSLSWSLLQPELAKLTRVCSYDRAGLGWSGGADGPATLSRMLADLRALLTRAGIPPPYILAGHSFGGLIARGYASEHPEDVAGLLLLDPVSVEQWTDGDAAPLRRLRLGVRLARRGAWLARIGVVRASLALLLSGARFVPKLAARTAGAEGAGVVARLSGEVGKLPREVWPMVRAHWCRPESFLGMARHLNELPANAEAARRYRVPAHIPLTIVSAANATPAELRERDAWVAASERGTHIHAAAGGHWIQLDAPELVAEAVRALIIDM